MTFLSIDKRYLDNILEKALNGISLKYQEVVYLLTKDDNESMAKVMAAAREVRERNFSDRVFVYGFIYFSTYCRNHCAFCYYRKTNKLSPRYRKDIDEVVDIAARLADSGIHLVDLTMGEDPLINGTGNYDILLDMISRVKEKTGLPVMISPGVVPDEILKKFSEIGVDWYALYQETHNPVLFNKLRVGQNFKERCESRAAAHRLGMLTEDGMMLGVGETTSDRANSISNMSNEGVQQVRVMTFVPQPQTPMAGRAAIPWTHEYLSIAVMRLMMPDSLIPASLDVDGINGLKMRIEAGANVVTSIIPPSSRLAGVSQSTLDIDEGRRTVPEVKKILSGMGLEVADISEYVSWIADQKEKLFNGGGIHDQNLYSRRSASGFGSRLSGPAGWLGGSVN